MADKFDPTAAIRSVAKAVAWITAFVAPIKGAYEYVHSGHAGLATQLSLWQVLWNLAINFGYFLLIFFVALYIGAYVVGIPLGIIVSILSKKPPEEAPKNLGKWVVIILAIFLGPYALVLLAGAFVSSFDPGSHSFFDDILGVVGGVGLFSIYLYVYLAATGKLEEKKAS